MCQCDHNVNGVGALGVTQGLGKDMSDLGGGMILEGGRKARDRGDPFPIKGGEALVGEEVDRLKVDEGTYVIHRMHFVKGMVVVKKKYNLGFSQLFTITI